MSKNNDEAVTFVKKVIQDGKDNEEVIDQIMNIFDQLFMDNDQGTEQIRKEIKEENPDLNSFVVASAEHRFKKSVEE